MVTPKPDEGPWSRALFDLGPGVERATGIEPALSAWELHGSPHVRALSWVESGSRMTVVDPSTPGLIAR